MTFSRRLPKGRDDRIRLPRHSDELSADQLDGTYALLESAGHQPRGQHAEEVRKSIDAMRARRRSGRWQGGESTQSAERASPVQRERAEQVALTRAVQGRWWRRGYRHIEQATPDGSDRAMRAASKQSKAGVRPGVLDTELIIPGPEYPGDNEYGAVRALLELKRPDLRPKRNSDPYWWRQWVPDHESSVSHGLSGAQWRQMMVAEASGFDCMVAYSAIEALEWFDHWAGPEREVDWPMYGCERGALGL